VAEQQCHNPKGRDERVEMTKPFSHLTLAGLRSNQHLHFGQGVVHQSSLVKLIQWE
jgi:hypothetical protein